MARATFGGGIADFVIQAVGGGITKLAPATLSFYTARTGGTQVTDLLVGGSAAATVSVGSDGQVPQFQGPDGVFTLWADGGGGRVQMVAVADAVALATAPADTTVATAINNPASATAAALATSYSTSARGLVPYGRPLVLNRRNLGRFSDALKNKACPVITCLGNSITWGVGSDDSSATTAGYNDTYQQYAWPVQLRKLLSNQQPCQNFVFLDGYSGYATLAGTAALSQTVGAFGGYGSLVSDATRGGINLPDSTATVSVASSKTGRFTEMDVFYWGTASGVTGGFSPAILVDGVTVSTGGVASAGNLVVQTVTGLTDAAHTITLGGTGTNPTWVAGVVLRRSSGIVVNRIGAPGVDIAQTVGPSGWTSAQRARQADAAVLAGYSDLVIISMTANEFFHQLDLATQVANLTTVVNRAVGGGACVLLMGDPAAPNEESASPIKGSQYRQSMIDLANTNGNVAYADFNAIFGNRNDAFAMGMFPNSGTVHPSREGHRRMADLVIDALPAGPTI